MNIKEIRPATVQNFDLPKFKPETITKNASVVAPKDMIEISKPANWSKDILTAGLKALENKMQMANNSILGANINTESLSGENPLDKVENAPIETYSEALEELKFFKTNMQLENFRTNTLNAQGNISADVVKDLLMYS